MLNSSDIRNKNFRLVVTGMGRVGLPLAVSFALKGVKVVGVEKRPETLNLLTNTKNVPFMEKNLEKALEAAIKSKNLSFAQYNQFSFKKSPIIILTVGTPLKENLSPDMSQVNEAIERICKDADEDSIIILRSTLVPGTTEKSVMSRIRKSGKSLHVAVCPERIMEGKALEEVTRLPEIVGTDDECIGNLVRELFLLLNDQKEIKITDTKTAEAAKIFTNVYRYVTFALANEFALISEKLGIDSREAISLANNKYHRSSIPMPGPAAGPCLRKDGLFLSNISVLNLIKVAWLLNESIPLHIIDTIENRYGSIYGKVVGVLGRSYKSNIDDERDSPAVKLIEELNMKGATVKSFDPHSRTNLHTLKQVLESEIVILIVNHSYFDRITTSMLSKAKLIYDAWGQLSKLDLHSKGKVYLSLGVGREEVDTKKWNYNELMALKC